MLRIKITSLPEGEHHYELEPTAEMLDLEEGKFTDLHVDARLFYYDHRIQVLLSVEGAAQLVCDRTLQPFTHPLRGDYALLFAPPDLVEEVQDEQEDVRPLHPSDQEIDLTDAVRDTLLLALPTRCIAPGAEEIEIPTQFGAPADAIDPRWEALRQLRDSDTAP